MQSVTKLLRGLRLTDEDGSLSLTSVALLVVLVKTAMAPSMSMEDVGLFLAAVSQYSAKKYFKGKAQAADTSESVASLGQSVQALSTELTSLKNKTVQLDNRTTGLLERAKR